MFLLNFDMNLKKVKNIKFLAKGKRSKVYSGVLNNKKVALKFTSRADKEASWLKLLNKKGIGLRYIFHNKDALVYEFVDGIRIIDYIKKEKRDLVIKVLVNVLKQCLELDKLKINKLEMHNPYKHVLIGKKVVLIDFERCYKTKKPKNVTQFCQFMMSKLDKLLKEKKINIDRVRFQSLLKNYKESYRKAYFSKILDYIKSL